MAKPNIDTIYRELSEFEQQEIDKMVEDNPPVNENGIITLSGLSFKQLISAFKQILQEKANKDKELVIKKLKVKKYTEKEKKEKGLDKNEVELLEKEMHQDRSIKFKYEFEEKDYYGIITYTYYLSNQPFTKIDKTYQTGSFVLALFDTPELLDEACKSLDKFKENGKAHKWEYFYDKTLSDEDLIIKKLLLAGEVARRKIVKDEIQDKYRDLPIWCAISMAEKLLVENDGINAKDYYLVTKRLVKRIPPQKGCLIEKSCSAKEELHQYHFFSDIVYQTLSKPPAKFGKTPKPKKIFVKRTDEPPKDREESIKRLIDKFSKKYDIDCLDTFKKNVISSMTEMYGPDGLELLPFPSPFH